VTAVEDGAAAGASIARMATRSIARAEMLGEDSGWLHGEFVKMDYRVSILCPLTFLWMKARIS